MAVVHFDILSVLIVGFVNLGIVFSDSVLCFALFGSNLSLPLLLLLLLPLKS